MLLQALVFLYHLVHTGSWREFYLFILSTVSSIFREAWAAQRLVLLVQPVENDGEQRGAGQAIERLEHMAIARAQLNRVMERGSGGYGDGRALLGRHC